MFLIRHVPKRKKQTDDLIDLSRKLTIEFLNYVIHSKTLRKVFVTIKGYYYQAEIMGQTITWIVPHQFVIDRVSNVDLNVMKTFTEFYITLMGFINFKLYKSINAVYPPQAVSSNLKDLVEAKDILDSAIRKLKKRKAIANDEQAEEDSRDELISALNKDIRVTENKSVTKAESDDQQIDVFEDQGDKDDDEKNKNNKLTVQQLLALETLFKGLKFFLNREVPRESLTFVIRAFGGEVSWDKTLFAGATFEESDPSITHHIIDRDSLKERRLDRVYIQPQWVYDSVNMRILLPTADYLIGATLPPHLSPFVSEKRGEYVPPDKTKMIELRKQFEIEKASEEKVKKGEGGVESELETDTEFEKEPPSETENEEEEVVKKKLKATEDDKNDIDSFDSKASRTRAEKNRKRRERDSNKSTSKSTMKVKQGKLTIEDKEALKKKEDAEYRKMGIMMIPKKKKRLFDKITKTQRQKNKKTERMKAKRRIVDAVATRQQKSAKKFAHKTQK